MTRRDRPARPRPQRAEATQANLFAVAAPGLEGLVARELNALGLHGEATTGGVSFAGGSAAMYRANLHLRTASRVLLRLGDYYAASFSELRAKGRRLPWAAYLKPGQAVAVKATCHKSKLYHSDAVSERVAGAIEDALGQPITHVKGSAEADEEAGAMTAPAEGRPALVVVRLVRDIVSISLDTSGALLHQRGYRLATGKAPLRETLAAAMLLASGWDRSSPLVDPFCGAGTIPIEAALLARNVAPGRNRRFAFMEWPDFHPETWQALVAAAEAAERRGEGPAIAGSDRDAGAIEAARANAERAGVGEAVRFERRAVSDLACPEGLGWVVTNPPYGVRVHEGGDLRNLYAQLGKTLRARCPGWRVALLASDQRLARMTGLRFDEQEKLSLVNGGLRVTLLPGTVEP